MVSSDLESLPNESRQFRTHDGSSLIALGKIAGVLLSRWSRIHIFKGVLVEEFLSFLCEPKFKVQRPRMQKSNMSQKLSEPEVNPDIMSRAPRLPLLVTREKPLARKYVQTSSSAENSSSDANSVKKKRRTSQIVKKRSRFRSTTATYPWASCN
jgi:hypothetical protein